MAAAVAPSGTVHSTMEPVASKPGGDARITEISLPLTAQGMIISLSLTILVSPLSNLIVCSFAPIHRLLKPAYVPSPSPCT